MAGLALALGAGDLTAGIVSTLAIVGGIVATAGVVPRVLKGAGQLPLLQRALAGVLGVVIAALVAHLLIAIGIDTEALSHDPSAWAIVQEGITLSLFYGSMVAVSYSVLGIGAQSLVARRRTTR
jgi:hypothetical protein